ncbi:MAG: glycosyltransferase family 39 protein [Candidatus Moraniibacteriota bacterium]
MKNNFIFNILLNLKNIFKKIPKHIWILIAITAIGIFLRTYNFHDWLKFDVDQSRDIALVEKVLNKETDWPTFGPTMRKSQDSNGNLFHLGPAYYYFQIISAKIFGSEPDKLAYPDLLFSILSIPLFYFFLKNYFSINLSLGLTGLYSVSFFAIQHSRFAWNPNAIPFFVILFLLSSYKLLEKRENTHWSWLLLLGIAIGIGIQLHIIILILFLFLAFLISLYLIKSNWRLWKKIIFVIGIVAILNLGQLISEIKTDFSNSKILLNSAIVENSTEKKKFLENLVENMSCHIEANAYIISSVGSSDCSFTYAKLINGSNSKKFIKEIKNPIFIVRIFLNALFFIFGIWLLIYNFHKEEKNPKRYFLALILSYLVLSFIIMLPVSDETFASFRYFNHIFFMPFIFLGLIANYLNKKSSKFLLPVIFLLFLFFIITNFNSTKSIAKQLFSKSRSDAHVTILGETKLMMEYIIENSDNLNEAYFVGSKDYRALFFPPFSYIAKKENFNIYKNENEKMLSGKALFYITDDLKYCESGLIGNYTIKDYKKFGKIIIYKVAI